MSPTTLLAIRSSRRTSWNQGRLIGQKRPLLPTHVWAIRALRMFGLRTIATDHSFSFSVPVRKAHASGNGRRQFARRGQNERVRPLARKNALFAGSDDGAKTWARIASLIGTCKLNGVNPETYIAATLRKILDQHMQSDIDGRMPWNFAK